MEYNILIRDKFTFKFISDQAYKKQNKPNIPKGMSHQEKTKFLVTYIGLLAFIFNVFPSDAPVHKKLHWKLRIWSHLLKKSLMEKFFCVCVCSGCFKGTK